MAVHGGVDGGRPPTTKRVNIATVLHIWDVDAHAVDILARRDIHLERVHSIVLQDLAAQLAASEASSRGWLDRHKCVYYEWQSWRHGFGVVLCRRC